MRSFIFKIPDLKTKTGVTFNVPCIESTNIYYLLRKKRVVTLCHAIALLFDRDRKCFHLVLKMASKINVFPGIPV